jgi:hypothetical protein
MKRFVFRHYMYLLAGLIAAILMYACFLPGTNVLAVPLVPPGELSISDRIDISDTFKDENFRQQVWKWLGKSGTPGIITRKDILDRLPEVNYTFNISGSGIRDLSGLEYFDGLKVFKCNSNQLTGLPALPDTLTELNCAGNQLEKLPPLPAGLGILRCNGNELEALPPLPECLIYLHCYRNKITSLGELPAGLKELHCHNNELTALPDLPANLSSLFCEGNQLSALPDLPDTLALLDCDDNQLTSLPDLPDHISSLSCDRNRLTSLPSLPDSLLFLYCSDNLLTELPRLPSNIKTLKCHGNNLRHLPALPDRIWELSCGNNKLSSLPTLPDNLHLIECSYNALTELPGIPARMDTLDLRYNFMDLVTLDEQLGPRKTDRFVYEPQLRLRYPGSGIELGKGETERLENVLKIQTGTLSSGRITWSDLRSADIADLTLSSSDTGVARVDSSGTITGIGEGTCTVYALMHGLDTELTKTAVTVNVSGGTPRPGDSGIDYSSASGWAVEELKTAASYGLVTGKVKSSLKKDITREEFCSIAVKLYEALSGSAAAPAVYNPFTDTTDTDVLKAYEAGIVKGISADKFAPDNKITRQEICVMIYRAIKAAKPGLDYSTTGMAAFADEDKIASWAIQEVRFAFKNNIMKGTGGNKISPLDNTTREQGIVLVKRTYEALRYK